MEYIHEVWDTNRSLVTDGYDESLTALGGYLESDLEIHEIPSGTEAWTWEIPPKWSVSDAYISDGDSKLLKYDHPLRVVTYSEPVDRWVYKDELFEHLHWDASCELNGERLPAHPDAIPYVFKFYDRDWGFCIRETERELFDSAEEFYVHIDAEFSPGTLKVGEVTVEGETDETILLTAHLDHPAQVNDDLSGVAVGTKIMNALADQETRYTYTFLVLPETIGSVAFLSQNEHRIDYIEYGIFLEMLGTNGDHALQYSYEGDTEIDRAAEHVLANREEDYDTGPFRQVIGNDEMVTNGPGVGIPTVSLSRWPYDEYHTSLDTPEIISEDRLQESADTALEIVDLLEVNQTPVRQFTGPLFLSGYGLWDKWGGRGDVRMDFEDMIMCLEGDHSVLDIAEAHDLHFKTAREFIEDLRERDLVRFEDDVSNPSP
jgi:aminopeptidase-like protein